MKPVALPISSVQRRMMRRCCGLDTDTHAWRNFYVASRVEIPAWDELIAYGMAEAVEITSGLCTYRLTESGVAEARRRVA